METVIRVAVIYTILLLAFKLMGKREFGQLAPFEFLTLLMIPEIVSQSLVREDYSITNALTGVATLMALVFMTSVASYMSRKVGKVIDGNPTVIVRHGFLVPENLNVERITPDEVMSELHRAGFEELAQIKWAILEADGKINFIPWVPELLLDDSEEKVSG
jgi:uncharacterized membrane protein YcaP (DUF421 family)